MTFCRNKYSLEVLVKPPDASRSHSPHLSRPLPALIVSGGQQLTHGSLEMPLPFSCSLSSSPSAAVSRVGPGAFSHLPTGAAVLLGHSRPKSGHYRGTVGLLVALVWSSASRSSSPIKTASNGRPQICPGPPKPRYTMHTLREAAYQLIMAS